MRKFDARALVMLLYHIDDKRALARKMIDTGERDEKVSDEARGFISPIVLHAQMYSATYHLDSTHARVWNNGPFNIAIKVGLTWQELDNELLVLRQAIESDLEQRMCAFILPDRAKLVNRMTAEWEPVLKQFPSSADDITHAVECYALEQTTASVFHLMRVTERGLHALAKERKVKLPKNRPLAWAQWNDILIELGKKVDLIANQKAGPARDAALEFYRGAIGEFQAFKDVYRNHVIHGRKSCDEFRAASVLSHVKEFMGRLAQKIDENPKKQIKWGIR